MRVLSGIQPSGSLHLGNYFGMMKRMVEYQDKHELFCFIVNYHALTTESNPEALKKQTLEAAADFLALGLNPNKCVFWVQSDIPEVLELTWYLSNVTPMGLLERCHSYKDKLAQGLKPNHGLFSYPVLMTADILVMQGERIPVGADQKQHVEVARDIALKFNRHFGQTFVVPEPEIQHSAGDIPGTDGRKMSKSYGNTIEIFCEESVLKKRISSFKTDSTPVNEAKMVEQNDLFKLFSHFLDDAGRRELRDRFLKPGLKYSEIKSELVETIGDFFKEARQKRRDWEDPKKSDEGAARRC